MNKLLVAAALTAAIGLTAPASANDLPGTPEIQKASALAVATLVGVVIINGSDTPTVKTTPGPGPGPGPGEECEEGEELVNGVCVPSTTTTVTTSVTTTLPVTTTVTATGVN